MSSPYEIYKPTKMQIIVPIIILAVALVAGGIMLGVAKKLGVENKKVEYLAPGNDTMQLEAGNYTIYLFTEVDHEGKHYSAPEDYKGLSYKVLHNDEEVALVDTEFQYSFGEGTYKGITLKAFDAVENGEYVLETTVDNKEMPEVVVAVGMTDENLQTVITLTIISMMIIFMGILQFIGYLILNGGKYAYYKYKTKNDSYQVGKAK